jgi:hypothetical protein
MGVEEQVRPFFDRLMELRPVEATYVGLHEHDGRLPDGGRAEAEEEIELLARMDVSLSALAASGEDLDLELARYFAKVSLFQARELRLWEAMADAPDQIGTGIFLLLARDFAPLEERMQSIAARLEDVPRYLERSRERLTAPVEIFNRIALETAHQLTGLIDTVVAAAPGSSRVRIENAAGAARAALAGYTQWLERDVLTRASRTHAIGDARFEELLRLRRLPDPPDRLLELGHSYLAQVKRAGRP